MFCEKICYSITYPKAIKGLLNQDVGKIHANEQPVCAHTVGCSDCVQYSGFGKTDASGLKATIWFNCVST